MYTTENSAPEFVQIYANNLVSSLEEYLYTDIHYTYNPETDKLVIVLEPLNSIKFVYIINNITRLLIKSEITISGTVLVILRKYKRHILNKFYKVDKSS